MASIFDSISRPIPKRPSLFEKISRPIAEIAKGAFEQTVKGFGIIGKTLEPASNVIDVALGVPGRFAGSAIDVLTKTKTDIPTKFSEQVQEATKGATGSETAGKIAGFGALLAEPFGLPGKAGKAAKTAQDALELATRGRVTSKASATKPPKTKEVVPNEVVPPKEPPPPSKPPASTPDPFPIPENPSSPVDVAIAKLATLIKEAKPAARDIKAEQAIERGKRAAQVTRVLETSRGESAYRSALGKLKGELSPKARFEPIRGKLTISELDALYDKVRGARHYLPLERVSIMNGLTDILRGEIPQPKQLKDLEDIFGTGVIAALRKHATDRSKYTQLFLDLWNAPRSLITSLDASGILRQALIATVRHPVIAGKSFRAAMKETFSQKNFEKWLDDVKAAPDYPEMKRHGLYIADPRSLAEGLTAREEVFMSNIAEKAPWVRASQRLYVGLLNKMRVDIYRQMSVQFKRDGTASPADLKSLANFINVTTGRGNLGTYGERIAPFLNGVFFSPRLIAARLAFFNPVWYRSMTPAVRKEAVRSVASFVGAGLTILSLAKAAGAEVEEDPRSSDFGKIKVGDTRWDIWGGFQQWARVFSQIATGERKTQRGKVIELSKEEFPYESRLDVGIDFILGKLAPAPSLLVDLARGQNMVGEPVTIEKEAFENTIPLYAQDVYEVLKEDGIGKAFAVAAPAFFGVGVQHYGRGGSSTPTGRGSGVLNGVTPENLQEGSLIPQKRDLGGVLKGKKIER